MSEVLNSVPGIISERKAQLYVLLFALLLWISNWQFTRRFDVEEGLTQTSMDMRLLGVLLGFTGSFILVRLIWKRLREYLDRGVKIPSAQRLVGDWRPILYLAPLLFPASFSWTWATEEGVQVQNDFQYSGAVSGVSFVFCAFAVWFALTLINMHNFELETGIASTTTEDLETL